MTFIELLKEHKRLYQQTENIAQQIAQRICKVIKEVLPNVECDADADTIYLYSKPRNYFCLPDDANELFLAQYIQCFLDDLPDECNDILWVLQLDAFIGTSEDIDKLKQKLQTLITNNGDDNI